MRVIHVVVIGEIPQGVILILVIYRLLIISNQEHFFIDFTRSEIRSKLI